VTWLGFLLTKQEQELKVKVAEKTWRKLEEKLALAHQKPESPLRAIETINGWIRQQGPARPKADEGEPYARITHMAMTQAFEEIPSKEEMSQEWERAHAEWIKHRERVTTQESGNRGGSACRQAKNQGESVLNGEARARRASPNLCPTLELTIFTDGSCLPDQRVGGWAYIIKDTSGSRIESRSGSSPFTTNNRMELMAAIRALECVREPATIRIVTDSAYLARGLNEWLPRWRMQGMRAGSRHQRRRLANFDLWDRIAEFVDRHRVSCEWIQSHSGRAENEECDCMARHAAEQQGDLAVDRRQNQ
jgi:ribonuclease HI